MSSPRCRPTPFWSCSRFPSPLPSRPSSGRHPASPPATSFVGVVLFVLAYFVTFVVVERIYAAGRDKLRTIGWFARLIDWLFNFRDRVLAWVRATQAWAFFNAVKRRAAEIIARLRLRFGLG